MNNIQFAAQPQVSLRQSHHRSGAFVRFGDSGDSLVRRSRDEALSHPAVLAAIGNDKLMGKALSLYFWGDDSHNWPEILKALDDGYPPFDPHAEQRGRIARQRIKDMHGDALSVLKEFQGDEVSAVDVLLIVEGLHQQAQAPIDLYHRALDKYHKEWDAYRAERRWYHSFIGKGPQKPSSDRPVNPENKGSSGALPPDLDRIKAGQETFKLTSITEHFALTRCEEVEAILREFTRVGLLEGSWSHKTKRYDDISYVKLSALGREILQSGILDEMFPRPSRASLELEQG